MSFFLSCSLPEIERLFREEIVSNILYNLYTKRNIKNTFLLGCHNYKSLLEFSVFFPGCRIIKKSDQFNFPVNFEPSSLWLACYVVLVLYYKLSPQTEHTKSSTSYSSLNSSCL